MGDQQVYHPDMLEDDAEDRPEGLNSLDCFIDATRMCNPSCMAYVTYPRGDPKELNEQQAHCALLLFGERAARHLTVLASTLIASEGRRKTAEQDRQREKSMAPMGPFASPFPKNPKVDKT
jgi:hypothetical protein